MFFMSSRVEDGNGYVTIKGNPISKVGVYPYLGSSIGAPDANKIYYVYRPESELNNQETIDSFKGLPWIDDHEMLGTGYTDPGQKGIDGAIGDDVYFDSPYLRANLRVYTDNLKNKIAMGKKDLSPGYRCNYELSSGVFDGVAYDYIQRSIRGNHLATVKEGRTGKDVSVLDHNCIFTIDCKDLQMPAPVKTEDSTVTLDSIMNALTKLSERVDAMDKSEKERDDEKADRDDEKEEEKEEEKGAEDKKNPFAKDKDKETEDKDKEKSADKDKEKGMDAAAVQAAIDSAVAASKKEFRADVAKVNSLHDLAAPHIGSFARDSMDSVEAAKYIASKLEIAVTDGAEIAIVEAVLKTKTQNNQNAIVQDSAEPSADLAALQSKYN